MTDTTSPLDIREKLAHIDQMLADHDRKRQPIAGGGNGGFREGLNPP